MKVGSHRKAEEAEDKVFVLATTAPDHVCCMPPARYNQQKTATAGNISLEEQMGWVTCLYSFVRV
jgi:hypothetical protein